MTVKEEELAVAIRWYEDRIKEYPERITKFRKELRACRKALKVLKGEKLK